MTDRHLQGNQLQRLDSLIKINEGGAEELGAQSLPQVSRERLTTWGCKEWKWGDQRPQG